MMIKKTRIVQIIQEEVRKQQEAHAHDDGITPKPTAPTDELAYIKIQIIAAKDKLAELEAKHAELSGKEATTSQPPEELEREDTEWADTDYFKRMMGTRYRGRD